MPEESTSPRGHSVLHRSPRAHSPRYWRGWKHRAPATNPLRELPPALHWSPPLLLHSRLRRVRCRRHRAPLRVRVIGLREQDVYKRQVTSLPDHVVVGVTVFGGEKSADSNCESLRCDGHDLYLFRLYGVFRHCELSASCERSGERSLVVPLPLNTTCSGVGHFASQDAVLLQHCNYITSTLF